MLEQLWTSILDLIAQLVTPDWGKLISLMPVAIIVVVVVFLLWIFRALARAKPPRRGMGRVPPATPSGIHMPGPSFSPVFGAIGLFLILLGLVVGGISVVLGLIALALSLLYWLAEGMRVYDHDIGPTATNLPAVVSDGPPPGVHMPGPSWRPFLGAFGMFSLLLGLVFGEWLLAAGVIVLIATLAGWLNDAIREYRSTVRAETTGHLDNGPDPNPPRRLLTVLSVLIVGAAVLQSGIFIAGSANGGTPGSSGAPAQASGAPASGGTGRVWWARGERRRRHDRGQEHPVRPDQLHRAGRQAVQDRVRQRGSEHAPQHPTAGWVGDRRVQGRHRHRRGHEDL